MRTHSLIGRGLTLIVGLVLAFGGSPLVSQAQSQSASDPKTLVVGAAFDIKSLDPARGFEQIGGMVHKATYNTLVTLDENDISHIVPDLAQSWDVSPDAKVFTFHLRPGVKFQNSGNAMTAADVKWSLERAIAIKGNPSFLLDGITAVDALDDSTVRITKSDSDPAFIAKGSFPVFGVLDSKTVQAHGGTNASNAATADTAEQWLNQNSAGTGPFIMTRYTPDSEVDLQKFAGYWNGDAPFDHVIYRNIPTAAAEKLTLQAGDIDIATEVSPDSVADMQNDPRLKVVQGVGADIFFLLMNEDPNLTNGTMSNPLVQNAIRYALDYDGIKELVGGPGVTPPSILPVGFLGAYGPDHAFKRDTNMAMSLLAQAGYPNGFNIDLQYPTNFSRSGVSFDTVAQKIQSDLADVNINVTLRPGEINSELQNYRDGKEGLGFWLWGPDYFDSNDYLAFLPEGIVGKRANWTNADSDATIQQLRDQINVETDNGKRAQLWQQAQDYLMQNGPWASVIQPGIYIATKAGIANYVYNPAWRVDPYVLSKS
ncbi:MAG: ABC transporter substrate-binding protein [Chloroflexi bacterium]|nr:ABC transporter substrate-binding protein [Chloroflexota bacterium]MBV9543925.1 ABC transporter substrate-binding protein [Chloroflexota bacterium]